jgi:hypothetical protein
MPELATIADVVSIANRKALTAPSGKTLGITVAQPRYVNVPSDDHPNPKLEFVVDIWLVDGVSQILYVSDNSAGLARLNNVLVVHEAVGELQADFNVPVEVERSLTGQLQVTGRAKVALPTLRLDQYSLEDLDMLHVEELTTDEAGNYYDGFGILVTRDSSPRTFGPTITNTMEVVPRLSTLAELGLNDSGSVINLGINPLQRSILSTARNLVLNITESLSMTEELING